jgi:hypothetical protein
VVYSTIYLPKYFQKDLYSFDESINSVVSANLYRDFWNPSVRLNSMIDDYQDWTEGPQWQHIPPLFAYVPLPLFWLDGQVSIEMKRLSYVLLAYLMFALLTYYFSSFLGNTLLSFSSVVTCILWTHSPFVKGLLQGGYFGYSDIVLAFTISASIIFIIHFLVFKRHEFYALNELSFFFYAFVFSLPILAKNALGGLPIALFFVLLIYIYKNFNRYILTFLVSVILFNGLYYGIQFYKHPEVFKQEFLFSFAHFGEVEGWKRPWHFFVSNYLPKLYLSKAFIPTILILVPTIIYYIKNRFSYKYSEKIVLDLFLLYFALHVFIITFITSKSPNFLLQSFHFFIFFLVFNLGFIIKNHLNHSRKSVILNHKWTNRILLFLLCVSIFVFIYRFNGERTVPSKPSNVHYLLAEAINRELSPTLKDIFITYTDTINLKPEEVWNDKDTWLRYYILFVSGSESRTMEEFIDYPDKYLLPQKFDRFFIITSKNYSIKGEVKKVLDFSNYAVWETNFSEITW